MQSGKFYQLSNMSYIHIKKDIQVFFKNGNQWELSKEKSKNLFLKCQSQLKTAHIDAELFEIVLSKADQILIDDKNIYVNDEQTTINEYAKNLIEEYKQKMPFKQFIHQSKREKPRKVVFLVGPTNSGKTYQALSQINPETKAVYLAPLRLLAIEVFQKMNGNVIPCSIVTGEEKIILPNANMVASTIEMLDMKQHYDIAIIDEYQMINDKDRGSAWTNAILNVDADCLYILGSPRYFETVKNLICEVRPQDIIESEHLERKSQLTFNPKKFQMNDLQKGDAIVVFSQKKVEKVAFDCEQMGYNVSILYGSLPLETRTKQAHCFASGLTDILVTTDVIGMGLNLPIKRILFGQGKKFDGTGNVPLDDELIKQIAGRAGRYDKNGEYGAIQLNEFEYYDFYMDFDRNDKNFQQTHSLIQKVNINNTKPFTKTTFDIPFNDDLIENVEDILIYQYLFYRENQSIFKLKSKINYDILKYAQRLKYLSDKDIIKLASAPIDYAKYNFYYTKPQKTTIGLFYDRVLNAINYKRPARIKSEVDKIFAEVENGRLLQVMGAFEYDKALNLLYWLSYHNAIGEYFESYHILINQESQKVANIIHQDIVENYAFGKEIKQYESLINQKESKIQSWENEKKLIEKNIQTCQFLQQKQKVEKQDIKINQDMANLLVLHELAIKMVKQGNNKLIKRLTKKYNINPRNKDRLLQYFKQVVENKEQDKYPQLIQESLMHKKVINKFKNVDMEQFFHLIEKQYHPFQLIKWLSFDDENTKEYVRMHCHGQKITKEMFSYWDDLESLINKYQLRIKELNNNLARKEEFEKEIDEQIEKLKTTIQEKKEKLML